MGKDNYCSDEDDGEDENESFKNIGEAVFENIGEVVSDKDTETFDMKFEYFLDLTANNSPVFINNNDSINIYNNSDFNATLTNELTFDDDLDKTLVFVYLDDDISDGFIADEDEFFIAASLIDRNYVNDESNIVHQSYPSVKYRKHDKNATQSNIAFDTNKINRFPISNIQQPYSISRMSLYTRLTDASRTSWISRYGLPGKQALNYIQKLRGLRGYNTSVRSMIFRRLHTGDRSNCKLSAVKNAMARRTQNN
ncbi:hypothetical protein HELRODRAFT_180322 [Helobdella robusta]|uniref:Uncharacterized protein n=1 Tax=Helobdella robusta TaxID=6412 RepID=T1FFQ9_HELRO|nr:hypothetical protein HELRODRAFT_180322 [Helobdella robusta]ESN93915.1 hypothetical protein HELRODRAFT_180322 [Helobdella robusta]